MPMQPTSERKQLLECGKNCGLITRTMPNGPRGWSQTFNSGLNANRCIDCFLTQILPNHGCFVPYLSRIKKIVSTATSWTRVIIIWSAVQVMRQELEVRLGRNITTENLIDCMISSKDNCDFMIHSTTTKIMKKQQQEEKFLLRTWGFFRPRRIS